MLKRVKSASFGYAASRALMYLLTSFSLVFLTEWFGYYGLWIVILPTAYAFHGGVRHFEKLEGLRTDKPLSKPTDDATYDQAA